MSIKPKPFRPKAEILTTATAADVEAVLASALASTLAPIAEVWLARNLDRAYFLELWSSILIATLARRFRTLELVDWNAHQGDIESYKDYFLSSMPLVTALALEAILRSADDKKIVVGKDWVEDAICSRTLPLVSAKTARVAAPGSDPSTTESDVGVRGMLRCPHGDTNTVCEFDPNHSLADLFSGGEYPLRSPEAQTLFRKRILQFRTELEFGTNNRGMHPVDAGDLGEITKFLMELHENSHDYGRYGNREEEAEDRAFLSGVRFVRLKKYIGTTQDLIKRAEGLEPLQEYLARSLRGKHSVIVEASVSDFGLGIVDFFRTSLAGSRWHAKRSDREILSMVFRGRLTSKVGDPAAGAGIYKALRAVRQVAGFASLRTHSFWLQKGFHRDDPESDLELGDMLQQRQLAKVSGTHWTVLYHQSI